MLHIAVECDIFFFQMAMRMRVAPGILLLNIGSFEFEELNYSSGVILWAYAALYGIVSAPCILFNKVSIVDFYVLAGASHAFQLAAYSIYI